MHKQAHHQWDATKTQLDQLIRFGRLETTIAKAKELQQYAEEIVVFAKKDTPEADLVVESMLRTPAARRKLYEELVPRYAQRSFYVTRVVNQFRFRLRDSAPMAFIEFVDRPGELLPAVPVGYERKVHVWEQIQQNRRNARRFLKEASYHGLIQPDGTLLPSVDLIPKDASYEWDESDSDEEDPVPLPEKDSESATHNAYKQITGPAKALEPFYVNVPPPSKREHCDSNLRRKFKP